MEMGRRRASRAGRDVRQLWFFKTVFLLLIACTPAQADEAGDAAPRMISFGGFSPSLFNFVVKIPYTGGAAGGWQEATALLKFVDGRQSPPQKWACSIWVGMPVHPERHGDISPHAAAILAAEVATHASRAVMHRQPYWLTAEYCAVFVQEMRAEFTRDYPYVGAHADRGR